MGIEITVEDEEGNKVESLQDVTNVLHRVLPPMDDPTYHYLNRIDWYGDTTFNRYQLADVANELQRVVDAHHNAQETAFLQKLMGFVKRSASRPHLYLKFYGD